MDRSKDQRIQQILRCISPPGKVINLGCAANIDMHRLLAEQSIEIHGVDLQGDSLSTFIDAGFSVTSGNVEQLHCTTLYDYAVAGELIEHLNNIGLFLESSAGCLRKGGKLIITTPNISSIFNILSVVLMESPQDPTHICYFDRAHLNILLGRFSNLYKIKRYIFIPPNIQFRGNLISGSVYYLLTLAANLACRISPRLFSSYILVELERL